MNRLPSIEKRNICPAHPGDVLKGLYLDTTQTTVTAFSEQIGVSRKAVSAIVNGKKSITPEMAVRISKATGTEPQAWLSMQNNFDLWQIAHQKAMLFNAIKPLKAVASLTLFRKSFAPLQSSLYKFFGGIPLEKTQL